MVELKLRAKSESDAVAKVKKVSALQFCDMTTLESARTVFARKVPESGVVTNVISALGSVADVIEKKEKKKS